VKVTFKEFILKETWFFAVIISWAYCTFSGKISVGESLIAMLLLCVIGLLIGIFYEIKRRL